MTLEEAIAHARAVASVRKDNCEQCAKDHEQLAEWLEELKDLRQGKADAVDEFANELIKTSNYERFDFDDCLDSSDKANDFFKYVFSIAEQLKEKRE